MLNLSMTCYNICKNLKPESVIRASTFVLTFIKKDLTFFGTLKCELIKKIVFNAILIPFVLITVR